MRFESLEFRRVLASFVVTTNLDVVDGADGVISLREAAISANESAGSDVITFDAVTFAVPSSIELTLGAIDLTEGVEIQGPGRDQLSIDGQSFFRVFDITSISATRTFVISDLTITGGRTIGVNEDGGAIRQIGVGELTLDGVAITNSRTFGIDSDGGAVFAAGTVTILDSLLAGNSTVGNGADGGAIAGSGLITITNSELIGNFTSGDTATGGAIRSTASLSINGSSITGNRTDGTNADGGAIHANSRINLQSSRITGNETRGDASDGGAISVIQALTNFGGGFTIVDSDIHGNATRGVGSRGGGLYADDANGLISHSSLTDNITDDADGGGVFTSRTTFTIGQSTVSGNLAMGTTAVGGGIAIFDGSATVNGSTVAGNRTGAGGGGVYFDSNSANSRLNISNSIVATNQVTAGNVNAAPDVAFFQNSPVLEVRSSLVGSNIGSMLTESQAPDANGNLIGGTNSSSIIDPRLADLIVAGGTRVRALLNDSPAINRGDASLSPNESFDQRGSLFDRVADSEIDMGSFEFQSIPASRFVVTTLSDELDFANSVVSLREAIITANEYPGADSISFSTDILTGDDTISLTLGQLLITDSVSIVGPGRSQMRIDAQGLSRVIEVIGDGDILIADLALAGGRNRGANEVIVNSDSTPVTNQNGGAIRFAATGTLTLRRLTIADNHISGISATGGAVWAESGSMLIEDSVIENNSGGGVAVVDGEVSVTRSAIINNVGAGITLDQSIASIINTTIAGNSGVDGGGVRATRQSDVSLVQSTIVGNSAQRGGGIYIENDLAEKFRIANSIIAGNQASMSNPDLALPSQLGGVSIWFSLIGDNAGTVITESQTAGPSGNLVGSSGGMGVIDPLLGPVSTVNEGVPFFELQTGSPAIDSASNPLAVDVDGNPLNSDVRGLPFVRVSGTVDMGAVETQGLIADGDRGDAPESYSTRLQNDGPRHAQSSLLLGTTIDYEIDGRASAKADGDGGDEDGVRFATSLIAGVAPTTGSVLVTASAVGMLDAWIDFNRDGVFDPTTEHLGGGTSISVVAGVNVIPFVIPAGAAAVPTFARFRLSSTGGLLPTGPATDGEVEDYSVTLLSGASTNDVDLFVTGSQIRLVRELDELVVMRRTVEVFRAKIASIDRLTINGDEFSNVLTVDQSGGDAIPTGGLTFDGGDRVDTLRWIGGDGTLDLTATGNVKLLSVAAIDLTDAGKQSIVIDSASARAIDPDSDGIIITGESSDRISFRDGQLWRMRAPEVFFGQAFSITAISETFVQTDFGSGWQNLATPSDINNNGQVSANDALVIINELGRRAYSSSPTGTLVNPATVNPWPGFYYDQNGDGLATALDALRVINQLARISSGGESGSPEFESVAVIEVSHKTKAAEFDRAYADDQFLGSLF